MKKILYLTLVSLVLTGCGERTNSLKILCPTGAPAVAFYNHALDSNFETNSVPKNIVSEMNESSNKDIIVIDTVSGLKAINGGAPYKLASTITFGNFYLTATGNDDDGIMNTGDIIVLFGEKSTPDYLFHYIYGNEFDDSIEYVNAVNDAAACLSSGKNQATSHTVDYVFLAQPAVLTQLTNDQAVTHGQSYVYANIQEKYREKSGSHNIVQASVFVKNSVDETKAKEFLNSLKNDINAGLEDPNVIKDGMDKLDPMEAQLLYGLRSDIAKNVTIDDNKMGLGYKDGISNKTDIDLFISLFGVEETNEEIYFK